MSAGNDYNFEAFLNTRERFDFYQDDPVVQALLKHHAGQHWQAADRDARRVSAKVSTVWDRYAQRAARPERHPRLIHFDAHNRRIDHIERAAETRMMEREIFGLGLFSDSVSPWQRLIQLFLIYQIGEASIACPLTCTEGLVAILDRFAEGKKLRQIRRQLKQGVDGEYAIGAQFLSEIQGGSDVMANRVAARQRDCEWRIYGRKFFCSVAHADYAIVSAKPEGSDQIAAFVVPAWLPADQFAGRRNGYRIERLKWKMGTCELPTAEIDFDGALAYPVGPLERGLAHLVEIVLGCSRVTIGIFSAAIMTRAAREARAYAEFRYAFGRPIAEFPMLAAQLDRLEDAAQCTTAGVFGLAQRIAQRAAGGERDTDQARRLEFDVRSLIMLQKIYAAADSVAALQTAISIFGGHGVVEDFSVLPRLLRDAMVNELWEGPKNVLLLQIHRDLSKSQVWYPAAEFVQRNCAGDDAALVAELIAELEQLLAVDLNRAGKSAGRSCAGWDRLCSRLLRGFQQASLTAAGLD